ncbi:MAG: endonuclease/exonuclease/phosphatase family protein [Steroidobacter sp.]
MSWVKAVEERPALILIRKIALAGVILSWLALLAGMLGRYAWPLDLFAHFRLHYCAIFLAFGITLLFLQRRILAVAALIGAVVSAVPVLKYMAPMQSAAAHGEIFRLVSFNIWFRNDDDAGVAGYLRQTGADAIVLQEAIEPVARRLHALLPTYPYAHFDRSGYGAVVFSKWPLISASAQPLASHGSQAAHVQIDWRGSVVTLVGVHLHWPFGPRNARLRNQELLGVAAIASAATGPLLIAGDFNVTPWSPYFQNALAQSGMNDCARGNGFASSWPSYATWIGIRIDHCLASRHWRVIDVRTGPHVGSDHRPVIADLALKEEATSD